MNKDPQIFLRLNRKSFDGKQIFSTIDLSLLSMIMIITPTTALFSYAQNDTNKDFGKSLDISKSATGGAAEEVFKDKAIILGSKVKNVIILIPNEGHESPALPKEQRQINQPYVPENIVVNPRTNIVWLNGDVGHEHVITLNGENLEKIYDSGKFDFNKVSIPLTLNKTGKFTYSQANVNVDDPKFVMDGNVTVKDTLPVVSNISSDTVGFFMIPAKGSEKLISELTDNGIQVLNKYTFKDLRGGQKGIGPDDGPDDMLLLVGGKGGQDKLISTLQKISPELPYS